MQAMPRSAVRRSSDGTAGAPCRGPGDHAAGRVTRLGAQRSRADHDCPAEKPNIAAPAAPHSKTGRAAGMPSARRRRRPTDLIVRIYASHARMHLAQHLVCLPASRYIYLQREPLYEISPFIVYATNVVQYLLPGRSSGLTDGVGAPLFDIQTGTSSLPPWQHLLIVHRGEPPFALKAALYCTKSNIPARRRQLT
jgi:hypothetical protein